MDDRTYNFGSNLPANDPTRLNLIRLVGKRDNCNDAIFYLGTISPFLLFLLGGIQLVLSFEDKKYEEHKARDNAYIDIAQTAFPIIMLAIIGSLKYNAESARTRIDAIIRAQINVPGFFRPTNVGPENIYNQYQLVTPIAGNVSANTLYIYLSGANLHYTLLTPDGSEVTEQLIDATFNPIAQNLANGAAALTAAEVARIKNDARTKGHTFNKQPDTVDSVIGRLLT